MPSIPLFDSLQTGATLGLVLHTGASVSGVQCVATRAGVFRLAIVEGRLTWGVNTQGAGWHNVTARKELEPLSQYIIKVGWRAGPGHLPCPR